MKIRQWFVLAGVALTVSAFSAASAQNVNSVSLSNSISVAGEVDTYVGTYAVPFTLTVNVVCDETSPGVRPLDPIVALYNSAGNLLAFDDDSGPVECGPIGYSSTFTIGLQPGIYEVDVYGYDVTTGPYTIIFSDNVSGGSGFGLGQNPLARDGRLNPDAQATAVLYCNATTRVTEVYTISGSSGTLAFSFTNDEATNAEAGDIIGSGNGATVEKLADGRLLLRSPMSGGKNYLFIWNGCPLTRSETYSEDFNFGSPVRSSSRG